MLRTFRPDAGSVISLLLSALLLMLVPGCASERTKYQAYEKQQGYRDLAPEDNLRMANFRGNPYTKKFDAEHFAKFRAIEVCEGAGKKLTHILDVKDRSLSKDVIRSSSTGFPSSYYYGMSPFYNRYSSFGFGISSSSSTAYEETYVYPDFIIYFDCVDAAFGPEILLRDVAAEEMKLLVKDLKGALQVEKIMENSPNTTTLEVGDVILKAEGQRIQNVSQLLKLFSSEKREVPVEIIREGERKKLTIKSTEVSEFVRKVQEDITRFVCGKEEVKKRSLCAKVK